MPTAAPTTSAPGFAGHFSDGSGFDAAGNATAATATKAPTAPTPAAPANPVTQPTSIVSSGSASNYTNNTLVPALQTAQTNVVNQNAKTTPGYSPSGIPDGVTYDAQGNPQKTQTQQNGSQTSQTGQPTQTTTLPETTPGTPEYQLLNTPEAGYHFEYAPDGTRTEVVNGTNQPGFSLTAPATPLTGGNGVTQTNGTTIKQMSDGSYASYDANGTFQGPATAQQYQDAQTANQLSQNIAQLANGSYPLTPTEQAQVTALQQSFQALIAQQQTANANLTGGTTVAMNLYGMGTSLAGMGEIKGSIDSGLQKIADLNGKMVSAVAQMEESFRTEDMAAMKDAYDVLTSAQKDRQAAIDKLKSDADAKAKDMRDYSFNLKKQQFDETIQQDNLSLAQKKDAFDEYMQQADLDEKKKVDATEAWYKQQDIALRKQAQSPFAAGTVPPVQVNANGSPNAASQKQFLAALPPDVATMVQGLANYTVNPTDFATRLTKGSTGMTRADAVALAKQYDPSYDDSQWQSRQKLQNSFTSGQYSQNITSLNTAAAHITDLVKSFSDLNNKSGLFSILNKPENSILATFGSGRVTGADSNLKAAVDEMATAFKGSGATDSEIQDWKNSITRNSSKDQSKTFINKAIQLLGDRLNNLDETYAQGMGKPSDNGFLHDSVATQLLQLQQQGYDVNIPALQQNPTVKLSTAVQKDPALKSTVDQIRQIAPNITPEEIVQQLNLQ